MTATSSELTQEEQATAPPADPTPTTPAPKRDMRLITVLGYAGRVSPMRKVPQRINYTIPANDPAVMEEFVAAAREQGSWAWTALSSLGRLSHVCAKFGTPCEIVVRRDADGRLAGININIIGDNGT